MVVMDIFVKLLLQTEPSDFHALSIQAELTNHAFFAHLSLAKSPQSCSNNKEAYVFDLFIYNASAVKTSVKLFTYSCVITSIILLLLSLVLESPDIFLREQTVAKL